MSWSDTRRTLRKDHRWESGSLLEREEKEKLFNEHIEALTKKKREHFRQLLDETSAVRISHFSYFRLNESSFIIKTRHKTLIGFWVSWTWDL